MKTEDCDMIHICDEYDGCLGLCYGKEYPDTPVGTIQMNLTPPRCSHAEMKIIQILDAIYQKLNA